MLQRRRADSRPLKVISLAAALRGPLRHDWEHAGQPGRQHTARLRTGI